MKKLVCLILIVLMTVLPALPVQAVRYDYSIGDALFDETRLKEGYLSGTWMKAEDKTAYSVKLYKGTKRILTKQVSGTGIDFSAILVSKAGGAGTYYFTVKPTRGTEDLTITSDTVEITAADIGAVSKRVQTERKAAIAASGGGWMKGPGDIWIYYDKDGTQIKGKWVEDRGHRYYLDKNGIMLVGWQEIEKAIYYLEPQGTAEYPMGACWVNTTTPDGYKVDEAGARLDAAGKKEEAISSKQLSVVALSIRESQEPGNYTRITDITSGSGKVTEITYSSDPSTWTSQSVGVVNCRVELSDGKILKSGSKVNCSRASSAVITSKTSNTMNVEIHYIPKYVMETPSNLSINESLTLRWNKVRKASSYTVKVVTEEEMEDANSAGEFKTTKKTATYSTEQPLFSLSDHDIGDGAEVKSISISAVGSNKKTSIDSKALVIEDLEELIQTRTINGEFKQNSGGLQYYDEYGEKVTGWKEIAGDWYCFKKNGYAAGPGWYQDPGDDNWYYFDRDYHMVTGTVTLEDGTYVLNDGTDPAYPKGAWIR